MNERKTTDQDDTAQSEALDRKSTSNKGNHGALSRDVQAKIGQQLRAYYERLIEPPSDRFVDLLRQLDKSGGKDPPNDN
jgi:hypothetical protein